MAGGRFRRRRGSRDPFEGIERPPALPDPAGDDAEPLEIRSGSVALDLDHRPDDWNDEWRDAAFRLPSIPAAMDIAPAQVDAWLEGQARELDDVTRSTAARWSDDPTVLRAGRGSTWDDDTGSGSNPAPDGEAAIGPTGPGPEPDGTVQPDTVQPDEIEPRALQPDTLQPDAIQPDEIEPRAVQPDTLQPDTIQPDEIEPRAVQPDEIEPRAVQPDEIDGVEAEATASVPESPASPASPRGPRGDVVLDITATESSLESPFESPLEAPAETLLEAAAATDREAVAAVPGPVAAGGVEEPMAGVTAGPTTAHSWRAPRPPDPLEQTVARSIRTTGSDDVPPGRQRGERVVVVRGDVAPGSSWDDDDREPLGGRTGAAPGDALDDRLDDRLDETDAGGIDLDDTDTDDWNDPFDDTGTFDVADAPRAAGGRVAARFQPAERERRADADRAARDTVDELVGGRSVAHFVQVAVTAGWLAALIAGARAVIAVGAAANRSDDGLGTWQRIGSELGRLGTTQGLLLVVAVVLLGMSALGGSRIVERSETRSSSGLGVVGAAAVIGIAGGILAFLAARDLGAPTASALVDLVGAVGLSFAALLTALVSLRTRRLV